MERIMSKDDKKQDEQSINPFAQEIFKDELDNNDEMIENSNDEQQEADNQDDQSVLVEDNKLQEKFEQLNNQYLRLAADFDNYRKRQAQERESLLKYGAENTLKLLLPVLDTYARGKKACEEMDDCTKLRENYEVIFKQLFDALEKAGLKKIETIGSEFNPNIHEAVMQTPTNEHPDNSIIDELQAGYMLADRVLRAAMVNVAVNE